MRKSISLLAAAALMSVCITGCSFVKVVPIGEEASYTGKQVFDADAESGSDWELVVSELTETAVDLTSLLEGDGISDAVAVSATATIVEFNTDTPKYYLLIEPEGYTGDAVIQVQAGGVYSGTALRDVQTNKTFESFTNQTEWSQYGKSLNSQVDEQVVSALDLENNDPAGKTVTLVGAAEKGTGGKIVITPVSMTIE